MSAAALQVVPPAADRFTSAEIERIAIYNALTVPGGFAELARWLTVDDFTTRKAQIVFAVAAELQAKSVEPTLDTVACALVDAGRLHEIGGISQLSEMGVGIPRLNRAETLSPYCRSLRRLTIRRRGYTEAERLCTSYEIGEVTAAEFTDASKRLSDLESGLEIGAAGMGIAAAIEASGGMDALLTAPPRVVPIPWHFLRGLMPGGGFRPGQLWTLAARPGIGKSAMALQFSVWAAQRERRIGFFSLEMPKSELLQRLMAMLSGVPLFEIQAGQASPDARRRILAAMSEFDEHSAFEIFDDVHSMRAILARIADREKHGAPYDFVVVDYLGLVAPLKRVDNRVQEISQITRAFKLATMEHSLTILLLSQMNRQIESERGREPQLSDLREGGTIEQDSDGVMFIHQRDRKDSAAARLLVKKQRNGQLGYQDLKFFGSFMRFEEVAQQGRDYDGDE